MANFNNIKHEIDQNVNTNGVQAITGAILNETLKDMIDEVDDKKQDTLVAGQNITISGNVISATGGGSGVEYTAGNGIDIDQLGGSVYRISVDASDLAGSGLEVDEFGALKTDPSLVQGKLTAGDGITISQQNEISANIGSGLSIDPQIRCITVNPSDLVDGNGGIMVDNGYIAIDPSVVATQNDLSGYLPLEGGVLQQDSGVDTTLQVIDPDSEDYVKLVAPDAGDNPHIEIFENGSGDTKIYYDKIHSGNYDLNFPTLTQDETIATVSDINTATSGLQPALTAGDGIEIDANNEISVKAGTGLGFDANGYLINTGGGGGGQTLSAGDGIEIDQNDAINAKLGSGLQLDQNNNIEIDPSVVATQSDLSGYATQTDLQGYLPLTGGNLQASNIATEVRVKSPSDDSYVYLHAVDTGSPTIKFHRDIQNPTNGEVHEITIHNERLDIERWDQSGNTWMADTLYFPQFKTGTIALDTDLAGKQDTLTAGTGITIQNNVISATGGGGGTSFTPGDALELDQNDNLNVLYGSGLTLNGNNELEVDSSSITGFLPLTGGTLQGVFTGGIDYTALHISSPNYYSSIDFHADDNSFTATGKSTIEMTDSDGYKIYGTDGISDGTYTLSFPTLTQNETIATVSDLSSKQDTLTAGTGITIQNNVISATGGGGSGLWSSGTGTNSLLSPSAVASSATASGTGALNAGYYNGQSGYASFANGDYSANFGTNNKVSYANSFASGLANTTGGHEAFVGGGASNNAHGDCSAVIGGTFGSANGDNSVVIASGANGTANGSHSVAIGNSTASGYGAIAIGEESSTNANHAIAIAGAEATGVNSVAIGKKVGTNNENEIGLGFANKVYTSGTGSIKSAFTVGNGTFSNGNYTYSNGLELKGNSDFYVYGVGGFDGTNSYNGNNSGNRAKTLQEVLNDKQDTLTAGTGISISGNVISATGGGGNYLPLAGGTLQDTAVGATETLLDVQAPDSTGALSLSADTLAAMIQMSADRDDANVADGTTYGINFDNSGDVDILVKTVNPLDPTDISTTTYTQTFQQKSGTIALLSDISGGGSGSYSAGNGIDITSGTISVDTTYLDNLYVPITGGYVCDDISQPQTSFDVWSPDQMGYGYIHSYSEDSSDPNNVIPGSAEIGMMGSVPSNADETYEVYHRSNGTILVGYTTDNQGNTDSVEFAFPQKPSGQTYTLATLDDIQGGGGSYLPLTGGTLQQDPNNASRTTLLVESPSQYATAAIETVDLDPGNTSESMAKITLSDYDSSNNQHSATYYSTGIGTGNYQLSFPTLTQNETIATLSDIQGGGSSYTAGTGISISAQNVISNSAPDPGLWVAGTGSNSIKSVSAITALGTDSVAIGHNAQARRVGSIAIGYDAATGQGSYGDYSVAIGSSTAGGDYSYVMGHNLQTYGDDSVVLGSYNKSYAQNSGTSDQIRFAIGNGTGTSARSNAVELKQNNDIYVVGVGGFDGTNAGATGIHTLQYAIANAGGGGSSLWTSGTGTDSLVAPATITAGLAVDPAPGTGAISCGYDTDANGDYSFAQGGASEADGDYSFAANNGTAGGDYSAAFGTSGASGDRSFAAGDGSTADAAYSIALGGGNVVYDDSDPDNIIDAQYGIAIGHGAQSAGQYAAAFGTAAMATGNSSVGLGSNSSAEGAESLAMPYAFSVGDFSLAGGAGSTANAYGSIAIGHGAMTYDGYADPTDPTDPNAFETALGKYNYTEADIAFSIGCGYEDLTDPNFPQEVRQNAITITNDGKIYLKGLGGYTGTSVSGCTDLVSFLNNL